jgi:valyl-tRNA synthetase
MPFLADEIFTNLTDEQISVHLTDFPTTDETLVNKDLEESMLLARDVVEVGHMNRKINNVKVRVPLINMEYTAPLELSKAVLKIVKDELNFENLNYKKNPKLDIVITGDFAEHNQNKLAGEAREIIRSIQAERKKLETAINEFVNVTLISWPEEYEDYIKKQALIKTLKKGENFLVEKNV